MAALRSSGWFGSDFISANIRKICAGYKYHGTNNSRRNQESRDHFARSLLGDKDGGNYGSNTQNEAEKCENLSLIFSWVK
jgi:hypothetical protein